MNSLLCLADSGTVAQWVALPSYSSRVPSSSLKLSYCLRIFPWFLCIHLRFLWVLRFAPTSQKHVHFIFYLYKWTGVGLEPANVHFYADDTIIYTKALSVKDSLQTAKYQKVPKCMICMCSRLTPNDFMIKTFDGTHLERVASSWYLAWW